MQGLYIACYETWVKVLFSMGRNGNFSCIYDKEYRLHMNEDEPNEEEGGERK